MNMKPYEVYIQTNKNSYIIAVNSSEFLTNIDGWTKIDEGYGDRFHHAQGNYFDKSIYTESGVYQYKFVDGVAVECTAEEIVEQEKNIHVPEEPEQSTPNNYESRILALEEELRAAKILLGVD